MTARWRKAALWASVGVLVCAGWALAQAPDWGGAPGGPGPRAGAPGGPGGPGAGQAVRPGLMALLERPEAETTVTNTDKGVDLTMKAKNPRQVGALQEQVQQAVMNLEQLQERLAQAPERRGQRADALLGLLAGGGLVVSSRKTEDGMVVSFTSDKPEVVQTLQQNMPQWVAQAQARAERLGQRREATREALQILAKDQVKVEVKETDKGIVIEVTSDDPAVAKEIKEKLAEYFRNQQELARNVARAQEALDAGLPGGPAGGAMRRQGGPMPRRGPAGPPEA